MADEETVDTNVTDEEIPDNLDKEFADILNRPSEDDKPQDESVDDEPADNDTADDKPDIDAEEGDEKDEEDSEPIPERLVDAGKAAGLTDTKIVKLAEEHPDVLEAMAQLREAAFRVQSDKKEPDAKDADIEQPIQRFDATAFDGKNPEQVTEMLTKLAEQHNKLVDNFEKLQGKTVEYDKEVAERKAQIQADYVAMIDNYFDKVEADLPAVGKAKSLTDKQLAARQEIFRIADALDGPISQRLDKAVRAYGGMYGQAEDSLRRKLNKSKKKFTARPNSHKKTEKFKSGEEAAQKAFNDAWEEFDLPS